MTENINEDQAERKKEAMSALVEILRATAPPNEEKHEGVENWREAAAAAITNALLATTDEIKKQESNEDTYGFFIAIFEATATSLMGSIARPFFNLLFKTKDPSASNWDRFFGEAYQIGIREGKKCLELEAQISNDRSHGLREQNFFSALHDLELAYTRAKTGKTTPAAMLFYIRLFQGMLAAAIPAPDQARQYFEEECIPLINAEKGKVEEKEKELRGVSEELKERADRYEHYLSKQPEVYNGLFYIYPKRTDELAKEPIPLHFRGLEPPQGYQLLDPPMVLRAEGEYFAKQAEERKAKVNAYQSLIGFMNNPE